MEGFAKKTMSRLEPTRDLWAERGAVALTSYIHNDLQTHTPTAFKIAFTYENLKSVSMFGAAKCQGSELSNQVWFVSLYV